MMSPSSGLLLTAGHMALSVQNAGPTIFRKKQLILKCIIGVVHAVNSFPSEPAQFAAHDAVERRHFLLTVEQ